jgi:hypothetical protein
LLEQPSLRVLAALTRLQEQGLPLQQHEMLRGVQEPQGVQVQRELQGLQGLQAPVVLQG